MLDSIGKRLKCCRVAAGLKTTELLAKIKERNGALTLSTYSRWEGDTSTPQRKMAELKIIVGVFKENGLVTDYE